MKHPAEMQRFLQQTKLLRGALDMGPDVLFPRPGFKKKVVRGRGGHKGNSCGRGARGANQHFEHKMRHFIHGGNVPFYRVVRKHKFANPNLLEPLPSEVTLDHIQKWIEIGSLDPDKPIDMSLLVRAKLLESCEDGVKLTAPDNPHFCSKITIVVTEADLEAIKLVEEYGGKIQCRYYNREEREVMSNPPKFIKKASIVPTLPEHRDQIEYYSDPMYRGYLAEEDDAPTALLKVYRDSHEQNQKKRPLPENLSQNRQPEPDEISFSTDPRSTLNDYCSRWYEKKRQAFVQYRGTDQFARRLLKADAVKRETAV